MLVLTKIIIESFRQAMQSLLGNKLRSFLSLMGITIGIFCIIGVLSAVDSLEDNVRSSFEKLGNDVIYVDKFSWTEDPGDNYWKWMKNPDPEYKEYDVLKTKLKGADEIAYWVGIGVKSVKYRSNSIDGGFLVGVTDGCDVIFGFNFEKGRFFSSVELNSGTDKVILGGVVAEELFGNIEPIGKIIYVGGRKLEVVGVLKKEGDSLVGVMNFDEGMVITYNLAKKFVNLNTENNWGANISVKASEGVNLRDLKDEIRGIIRASRKLKPKEEDNFALNELSLLSSLLDQVFNILNIAGLIIGIFALIVGVFSVANIMFVSVKERTNLIGIKKALGAKSYMILLEFLIESVVLCILGGLMGMGIIALVLKILTNVFEFPLYLDMGNVLIGLGVSIFTGVLAGIIPAAQAANMNPVDAIRA